MCQCLICGCCWWNYCGVCCGGCHEAFCVCSYWICKPDDLRLIDPVCCHICAFDGWGHNCLCSGIICCAPRSVQEWSGLRSAGRTAADLNKQTIIINNTSPTIYMPQQEMSYQLSPNYPPPQGYGSPYYGSPNVTANVGPEGVNAKLNF